MKNSKAVTKGHSTITRLGILSTVTWMVVSFSAGSALAAETDFKLWELNGEVTGDVVKPITENDQKKLAKELLVGKKADFAHFMREFKPNQPAKFVNFIEGVREGLVEVQKKNDKGEIDKKKVADFKKFINDGIDKSDSADFGGPEGEVAMKKLLKELFELDADTLSKMTADELIKVLFSDESDEFLKGIKLASKKSEEKPTEKPPESPVPVEPPVTGEVNPENNEELRKAEEKAQQDCDKFKAAQAEKENGIAALVDQIKKGAQAALAKLAQQENQQQQDPNANLVADVLKGLKEEQQPQLAQQAQLPVSPTPTPAAEEDENPSVLDQGVPPPEQQQAQAPFFGAPTSEYRMAQQTIDAPKSPVRERKAAETASSEAEKALKETEGVAQQTTFMGMPLNPYQLAGKFGAALGKIGTVLESARVAEETAKNRFDKLDEQWAQVKSPSDLLSDSLRTERSNIEAELKRAENSQQDVMAQSQSADPSVIQSAMAQVQGAVRAAKSKLESFDTQYAQQVNLAKKAMDAGKAELAKLEDAWTALKGKRTGLEARKKELETALETNAAQAMSQQTAGTAGGYNIMNRVQGGTNRATTPRGLGAANGVRGRI